MSGAWYPFRAAVGWRGEQLAGCALEGADLVGGT
jgi:uncharacterized membrane protein